MAQDFNFKGFFPYSDFLKDNGLPKAPFDIARLIETQRRNFQTLAEAQQIAFRSFQSIATRQAEIFSQILKEQNCLTSEILKEGNTEDALARNAELIKKSYETTIAGMNEIGEIVRKSNTETSGVLNRRLKASLKEIKSAIETPQDDEDKRAA